MKRNKRIWLALLVAFFVVTGIGAWRETLDIRKLYVEYIYALSSNHTLHIVSPTITGATMSSPTLTGTIATGAILPSTHVIPLPLSEAYIVGTGIMGNDGTTAPGFASVDGIPKLVYLNSTENASLQWTFRLPSNYSSGLSFRVWASTSDATSAPKIRWLTVINSDEVAFAVTSYEQSAVQLGANSAVSNEEVALTLDATTQAELAAGRLVTLEIANEAYGLDGTLEIANIHAYFTAKQ